MSPERVAAEHHLTHLGGGAGRESFYCRCGVVTRGTDDEGFMTPHLRHVATVIEAAVRAQVAQEIEAVAERLAADEFFGTTAGPVEAYLDGMDRATRTARGES